MTTPYTPGKAGPIRINVKAKAKPEALERETFLHLDDPDTGESTEVTIAKELLPSQGLRFITLVRDLGELRAVAQMFDEVIKPKGVLDRLAKIEGITQGEIDDIMSVVTTKLMAAAEAAQGN
ncbi:MAG TPA: hypothetical protein VF516_00205 [Kofleriaceae bacterium]